MILFCSRTAAHCSVCLKAWFKGDSKILEEKSTCRGYLYRTMIDLELFVNLTADATSSRQDSKQQTSIKSQITKKPRDLINHHNINNLPYSTANYSANNKPCCYYVDWFHKSKRRSFRRTFGDIVSVLRLVDCAIIRLNSGKRVDTPFVRLCFSKF